MSVAEHRQSSHSAYRRHLTAAVAITGAVWLWMRLVGIVLGQSAIAGPFVTGAPVLRDVGVQVLKALFAVGVVVGYARVFDISSPVEWMRIRRPVGSEWAYIPLGFLVSFLWLLGSLIFIQDVLGLERTASEIVTMSQRVRISRVLTLLLLVGPAEELIFHGIIQRSLEEVTGLRTAILLGGLLFAVPHIVPAALGAGDLLFYGAQGGFGVIAGWIYARTDNLTVPALVHGIFISFTTALPLLG
jgi:membrane protease YdiL (CAAX protease family)